MSVIRKLAASPARSAVPAAPVAGHARYARHPGASCTCLPPRHHCQQAVPAGGRPTAFPGSRHRLTRLSAARRRRRTALPDRDCLLAPLRQPSRAVPPRRPAPGGPPRHRDEPTTRTGAGGTRAHPAPGVPWPGTAHLMAGPGLARPGVAALLAGPGARRPGLVTVIAGHRSWRPGPRPARCAAATLPWLSAARQLRRRALPAGPLLPRSSPGTPVTAPSHRHRHGRPRTQ